MPCHEIDIYFSTNRDYYPNVEFPVKMDEVLFGSERLKCVTFGGRGQSLTNDLKITRSVSHRVGVDLTHVPAAIHLLDVADVEVPGPVVVVGEGHPRVLGDDVMVDREDCLSVHPHPGHLKSNNVLSISADTAIRLHVSSELPPPLPSPPDPLNTH